MIIDLEDVAQSRGKWTDFVVQYKPSYQSTGILKVWKNNKLVMDRKGQNVDKEDLGPYLKFGLYKSASVENNNIVYHDDIRITADPRASYSDVNPASYVKVINEPTPAPGSITSSTPSPSKNPPKVNLWIDESFESGTLGELVGSGSTPRVVQLSNARRGKYVMRAYIDREWFSDNDPATTHFRSEAVIKGAQKKMEFDKDYWYGFSTYFPKLWEDPEGNELIAQFHHTKVSSDGENGVYLPFTLNTSHRDTDNLGRYRYNLYSGNTYGDFVMDDKEKWIDWVIHIRPSKTSNGIIEVWKNGVQQVSQKGINNYQGSSEGPYFKMGIYIPRWKNDPASCCNGTSNIKFMYHDELRAYKAPDDVDSNKNQYRSYVDPKSYD